MANFNNRPTYSNGSGWYMFFDGETWVISDTENEKTGAWITNGCKSPSCDFDTGLNIADFTGDVADANGAYKKTGRLKYGLPVYENADGWTMYYSVEAGGWVIEKGLRPNQKTCVDGSGSAPGSFDGNHANSTSHFSGMTGTVSAPDFVSDTDPDVPYSDGVIPTPTPNWVAPSSSSSAISSSSSYSSISSKSSSSPSSSSSISSTSSSSISSSSSLSSSTSSRSSFSSSKSSSSSEESSNSSQSSSRSSSSSSESSSSSRSSSRSSDSSVAFGCNRWLCVWEAGTLENSYIDGDGLYEVAGENEGRPEWRLAQAGGFFPDYTAIRFELNYGWGIYSFKNSTYTREISDKDAQLLSCPVNVYSWESSEGDAVPGMAITNSDAGGCLPSSSTSSSRSSSSSYSSSLSSASSAAVTATSNLIGKYSFNNTLDNDAGSTTANIPFYLPLENNPLYAVNYKDMWPELPGQGPKVLSFKGQEGGGIPQTIVSADIFGELGPATAIPGGTAAALDNAGFTIAFWTQLDEWGGDLSEDDYVTFLSGVGMNIRTSFVHANSMDPAYPLEAVNGLGDPNKVSIRFDIYGPNGAICDDCQSVWAINCIDIPSQKWSHIALSVFSVQGQPAGSYAKVFVDGVPAQSATASSPTYHKNAQRVGVEAYHGIFQNGVLAVNELTIRPQENFYHGQTTNIDFPFSAGLTDLRLYNRDLDASEIYQVFNELDLNRQNPLNSSHSSTSSGSSSSDSSGSSSSSNTWTELNAGELLTLTANTQVKFTGNDGEWAAIELAFPGALPVKSFKVANIGGEFVFDYTNQYGLQHTFDSSNLPETYIFSNPDNPNVVYAFTLHSLGSWIFSVGLHSLSSRSSSSSAVPNWSSASSNSSSSSRSSSSSDSSSQSSSSSDSSGSSSSSSSSQSSSSSSDSSDSSCDQLCSTLGGPPSELLAVTQDSNQTPATVDITYSYMIPGVTLDTGISLHYNNLVTADDAPGTKFNNEVVAALAVWKTAFESAYSWLTLNFNGLGAETGNSEASTTGTPNYSLPHLDNIGDIRFAAADMDGPGGTLAHAFADEGSYTGSALGSVGNVGMDVHIDTNDTFRMDADSPNNDISMKRVMVHEVGHCLGIGHSCSTDSIMFPSAGNASFDTLWPSGLGATDETCIRNVYDLVVSSSSSKSTSSFSSLSSSSSSNSNSSKSSSSESSLTTYYSLTGTVTGPQAGTAFGESGLNYGNSCVQLTDDCLMVADDEKDITWQTNSYNNSGSIYSYTLDTSGVPSVVQQTLLQNDKDTASNPLTYCDWGMNTCMNDAGTVFAATWQKGTAVDWHGFTIYKRANTTSQWAVDFTHTDSLVDGSYGSEHNSIAMSHDGSTLVISKAFADGSGAAGMQAGEAYVYEDQGGNNWTQRGPTFNGVADFDKIGCGAALNNDGTRVAINRRDSSHTGAIDVYDWNSGMSSWDLYQTIEHSDLGGNHGTTDDFGQTMKLNGAGDILATSAVEYESGVSGELDQGRWFIFEDGGTSFALVKSSPASPGTIDNTEIGWALDLNFAGNRFVVSSRHETLVYESTSGSWALAVQRGAAIPGTGPVRMSSTGNTIAVSGPNIGTTVDVYKDTSGSSSSQTNWSSSSSAKQYQTIFVQGGVPDWSQPLVYEQNGYITGNYITNAGAAYMAWCAPTQAANQLSHFNNNYGTYPLIAANGHLEDDQVDAGMHNTPQNGAYTHAWDTLPGWGDCLIDGLVQRPIPGQSPAWYQTGTNGLSCRTTDFGYFMETNNKGLNGGGGGNAVGTNIDNIRLGLDTFYASVGHTPGGMVGLVYHGGSSGHAANAVYGFGGVSQGSGHVPEWWRDQAWTHSATSYMSSGSPAVNANHYIGAHRTFVWSTLRHEIDNNRTVLACMANWNCDGGTIISGGPHTLNAENLTENAYGVGYFGIGAPVASAATGEIYTDAENLPEDAFSAQGLGHTLLIVGYIDAGTVDDISAAKDTAWLIVRDGNVATMRNMIIPFYTNSSLQAGYGVRTAWESMLATLYVEPGGTNTNHSFTQPPPLCVGSSSSSVSSSSISSSSSSVSSSSVSSSSSSVSSSSSATTIGGTEQKIVASDGAAGDYFGGEPGNTRPSQATSISGDYLVVGAPLEGVAGSCSLGNHTPGAAYIYKFDGSVWNEQQKIVDDCTSTSFGGPAEFGTTVAISGDYIIVGGDSNISGPNRANVGELYIWERDTSTDTWSQTQVLSASDAEQSDHMYAVALDGDTAVVGAYGCDDNGAVSGAAYIFERDTSTNVWSETKKILASDGQGADNFGWATAIKGDYVVIGAPWEDAGGSSAGAAYVFERNHGGTDNWGEVKKLVASDAQSQEAFGYALAVNDDWIMVGAYSGQMTRTGSAYVFERSEGGTANWGQTEKLVADDGAGGDSFGNAITFNDTHAIIGAPWAHAPSADSGAAYVFKLEAGSWNQIEKITASDSAVLEFFGNNTAIDSSGKFIIASCQGGSAGNLNGAAYVYEAIV